MAIYIGIYVSKDSYRYLQDFILQVSFIVFAYLHTCYDIINIVLQFNLSDPRNNKVRMSNAIYRPLRTPHNDVRRLLLLIWNDNNALIHCNDILDKVHRDTQDFEVKTDSVQNKTRKQRKHEMLSLYVFYTPYVRLVYHMLLVSLCGLFLIVPSVFSNVYLILPLICPWDLPWLTDLLHMMTEDQPMNLSLQTILFYHFVCHLWTWMW